MGDDTSRERDKDAAAAWIAVGVGLLCLAEPSWGGVSPLLAAAMIAPLGGHRPFLPLAAAPVAVVGAPAAGLALVAALLATDDLPFPHRALAVGLALLAGAGGAVATGGLVAMTPTVYLTGTMVGLIGSLAMLFLPGRLSSVVAVASVTFAASVVWGFAPSPFPGVERIALGGVMSGALAFGAHAAGKLDRPGMATGTVVGATIFALYGWGGFLLMTLFVVMGVGFTRSGERESHEVRGTPHVIANIGPAFLFAVAGWATGNALWLAPFAGALAAATADTLSAELGRRFGPTPVDLFSYQPVPAGTDGAVSTVGTLFGAAGGLVIALAGWGCGLYDWVGIPIVVVAGMAGSLADSALGSLYERDGALGNHQVNFLGASAGGLVALLVGLGLT